MARRDRAVARLCFSHLCQVVGCSGGAAARIPLLAALMKNLFHQAAKIFFESF
jgi:hypothetical protein